jgi:hypothetical protein
VDAATELRVLPLIPACRPPPIEACRPLTHPAAAGDQVRQHSDERNVWTDDRSLADGAGGAWTHVMAQLTPSRVIL